MYLLYLSSLYQTSDYDTYAIRTNSANPKKMERYLYTRHLYSMLSGGFRVTYHEFDIRFPGGMRLRQMRYCFTL